MIVQNSDDKVTELKYTLTVLPTRLKTRTLIWWIQVMLWIILT